MPPLVEQAPRVLLFDGASDIASAVRRAFDGTDYELRVHGSAENLKETLGAFAPDLILVDVAVKDGGFALCGELRAVEQGQKLPVVLLTKEAADESLVTRGLLSGADDFVRVTERLAEFQARVRVQLRNKRDRDRAQRLRVERDLFRREAALDPLTSLPNRRAVDTFIDEAWSKGTTFSIAFVDIDDFKQVNDGFGHDVGDQVLREVAGALAKTLRPGDRCGRFGGEEFVVIFPETGAVDAAVAAEKHRAAIEALKPRGLDDKRAVTASFGLATFDPRAPDANPEVLCQRADAALYDAKRGGKNRVGIARPLATRAGHVSLKMDRVSVPPRAADRAQLETALVRELGAGRAGLPLLPEAASEAMRLAEDPRTDIARIAKLVDRDPPLAARFVAIAGSALYSRGVKPTSTQAAFVRIGLAAARDLLLQAVYERTNQELPMFRAEVARSFERSVRTGIAARLVASELRMGYESAYLCGLLHDIGESRVYRILAQMPLALELPDFTEELVARHHQRAGADVARAWHLSSEIVEVCGNHHGATNAGTPTAVRIVMAADALVRLCDEGAAEDSREADLAVLTGLGLGDRQMGELLDRVRNAITAAGDSDASPASDTRGDARPRERMSNPSIRAASRRPTATSLPAARARFSDWSRR
ncbi:MAG: diguanylate cyclase [Polyangiaceae bacterium]